MQRLKLAPTKQQLAPYPPTRILRKRVHTATVVFLAIPVLILIIAIAWWSNIEGVATFFHAWDAFELNPPAWLQVPSQLRGPWLVLPTTLALLLWQIILRLSPHPRLWSRIIMVSGLALVTLRYLVWRGLATLNLDNPLDGTVSLMVFGMEVLILSSILMRLVLFLGVKSRKSEADHYEQAVLQGDYQPSVDILIPTYNESIALLRRTVIGCQAIQYHSKSIYLLDDGHRSEVKALALELGCHYLTRPSRLYAKAGNLNYALGHTSGELVTVFDADFIPTSNFLNRTVGFFQNERIGLLQTHQRFYNPDLISGNLGISEIFPHEDESFYRYYQPLRDTIGASTCAGSSFVVRRRSLETVGGFVTESLCEDYFTGLKISAAGDEVLYLDENLSAGLSADSVSSHIRQHQRWGRGTFQAFFISANPLTLPGLRWYRRLAHLEGIAQWCFSGFRVFFLLLPIICIVLRTIPVRASMQEWLYYFLPFYLLQVFSFSWVNNRSRSSFVSEFYEIAQCVPITAVLLQTVVNPFASTFKVTPKGSTSRGNIFDWDAARPLFVLWILTALAFIFSVSGFAGGYFYQVPVLENERLLGGMKMAWLWSSYHFIILSIVLMAMRDRPQYGFHAPVKCSISAQIRVKNGDRIPCRVAAISETVAQVELSHPFKSPLSEYCTIEMEGSTQTFSAQITNGGVVSQGTSTLALEWNSLNLEQERALVEVAFCQPGRWSTDNNPGEFYTLWVLLQLFLSPIRHLVQAIKPPAPIQNSIMLRRRQE